MLKCLRLRTGRFICLLGFFLGFVTNASWGQNGDDAVFTAQQGYSEWMEGFYAFLETSKNTQSRTLAGMHLYESGVQKDMDRGVAIIEAVLNSPSTEAVSLWTLAASCFAREPKSWCESGIYEKLIATDPTNAAALLMSLGRFYVPGDEQSLDTNTSRKLLVKASKLEHFDTYWGRGIVSLYNDALAFFKTNPIPPVLKRSAFFPQLGNL